MAYQPQTYQDGVTEYTDTLFQHMDDGIFGAYPVQLIAISSTAPSTCAKDDKYYNTSTKKIYTATATNTWGSNGETPLEDTSYWLISENGNYAWDGTDLVSIGGGKAEVVISDTEPEDGKLWVDTAEIPVIAGRDNLVKVSTEVDEEYRVNILHSKNLFNKNNVINDLRLGTNGVTITDQYSGTLFTSDYIELKPSTEYIINITGGNYTSRLCIYDSSKTFISYNDNGGTFTMPSNAKYIRFTYLISNINTTMLVVGDSLPASYEAYITPSINVDGEEIYSKPVVLWQNPNPSNSSGFVGQSITLNDSLDNYKYMEIVYFNTTANTSTYSTGKLKSKTLTTLYYMSGLEAGGNFMCRYRNVSAITSTTITFDTAYVKKLNQTSVDTANDQNIPYQVIGYK